MPDPSQDAAASPSRTPGPRSLDPRELSSVPPPPMRVVYKGWLREQVTERQASDLLEEDRRRRAAGR